MSIRKNLIRIIVCIAMFAVALPLYLAREELMPQWGWLLVFLAIYAAVGYDVILRAGRNILHGKIFDENFLMITATVGAFCLTEFSEAVAVMLFYQVGELFQSYAVGRSRRSIAALTEICPETACVVTANGERTVYPEEVEIGSIVVVRAGERVPIDGEIVEGEGYLDCSALTGESVPVEVKAGDKALSGAISACGVLKIRTERAYEDSTVAKILELVESSAAKKAKAENFITRFAAVYTPAVVISALLLAILPPLFIGYADGAVWSEWVTRALTFLVVSCPCALVISVPLSFFGGIGAASKRGILVKGGSFLELLGRTDTVVFDKTGTITKGTFEVTEVYPASGVDRADLLFAAAVAESNSLHPIARSIADAAEKAGRAVPACARAEERAGRGIIAEYDGHTVACGNALLMRECNIDAEFNGAAGGTTVLVARDDKYLGAIVVADSVKDDSKSAIAELKSSGVRTVMLTGDSRAAAERTAAQTGVDEYQAELLPDGKVAALEEIMARSETEKAKKRRRGAVAFVGDGINDAPVLSRADVGIAMGALGSDAAIEAADVVLMNDSLAQIVTAKRIAKKTMSIVMQNIVFALGVKAAVLVLAALGLAGMWLAVFADVGVAVLAILNAMRAMTINRKKEKSSEQ